MNATTTCEYGYQIVSVTATSSYPTTATSTCVAASNGVKYGDWIFVNGLIIFALFFFIMISLFGLIMKRRR